MDRTHTDSGSIDNIAAPCKPRLALMGEFSAGKSTLSNMLLGCARLPVKITATRLPPVLISYGEDKAVRVDMEGNEFQLDIAEISNIQLEETRMLKLFLKADVLEICDLIDMPGISDPNMSSSVWEDAFGEVDSVVWCTHATQAWRQSEAAAWDLVRSKTNGNNLIIISQFDKLRTERDRSRVLERVRKETKGLFGAVFPVALMDALNAGEDVEKWEKSGAADFTDKLVEMLLSPDEFEMPSEAPAAQDVLILQNAILEPAASEDYFETAAAPETLQVEPIRVDESAYCETPKTPAVMPRRVRPNQKGEPEPRLIP